MYAKTLDAERKKSPAQNEIESMSGASTAGVISFFAMNEAAKKSAVIAAVSAASVSAGRLIAVSALRLCLMVCVM